MCYSQIIGKQLMLPSFAAPLILSHFLSFRSYCHIEFLWKLRLISYDRRKVQNDTKKNGWNCSVLLSSKLLILHEVTNAICEIEYIFRISKERKLMSADSENGLAQFYGAALQPINGISIELNQKCAKSAMHFTYFRSCFSTLAAAASNECIFSPNAEHVLVRVCVLYERTNFFALKKTVNKGKQ